jgi:hypothetical protein
MDYQELEHMTVVKLREEAKKFDDIKGAAGMKKDELIAVLAEKHGLEKPEKKPKKKKAAGPATTKDQMKEKLKTLRALREEARSKGDKKRASIIRRRIHGLKRRMRKAA